MANKKVYEFAGVVVDITGIPLHYATIKNLTTKEKPVLTDNYGAFRINAHRGDTVVVSKPGYKSKTVIIKKGKPIKKLILSGF